MNEQELRIQRCADDLARVVLRDVDINKLQHDYASIQLGFCPCCLVVGAEKSEVASDFSALPESDYRYPVYYAHRDRFMAEVFRTLIDMYQK
jgi:hypothetical protein